MVVGVVFLGRHVFLVEVLHSVGDCLLLLRQPSDVGVVSAVTSDTGALPPVPFLDDLAVEALIFTTCVQSPLR